MNCAKLEIINATGALLRLSAIIDSRRTAAAGSVGLSALQYQILSLLAVRGPSVPVSDFARRFMISVATVSDSATALERKALVSKSRSMNDARSIDVGITDRGREVLDRSNAWLSSLNEHVAGWDLGRQAEVISLCLELISKLQPPGKTHADRICVGCRHLAINCDVGANAAPHYCRALNLRMQTVELRLDCPEFVPQEA